MRILSFGSRATVVAAAIVSFVSVSGVHAAVLQIADWNMGNLPNTVDDESQLSTVFAHMQALAERPLDLLAMQETDSASAEQTAAIARSTFGTASYTTLYSTPDGGSDRTGFVYNSATLDVIGNVELSGGSLTHHILRTHFQPVGGSAGSDFYVYSTHLRSGATSIEQAARTLEAQQLRADADALGSANVMFVGDFNWQGAAERGATNLSAYQVFDSAGEGHVSDAVNQVGAWRDNAAFLSLHTNDPAGPMDDRFDMQLISDELRDGVGLDFVPGSYRVIGNNGTHTLNGSILTGTGAPPDVLNALYNFDDHLPVMASYSFNVPEPTVMLAGVAFGVSALRRRRRIIR